MFVFCILWSLVAESNWHHIDCFIHYRPQKYHIHDETEERDFLFSECLIWCCSAVLTEKGCKFALLPYFLKGKHPELYRFITWYSTKSSHYNFFWRVKMMQFHESQGSFCLHLKCVRLHSYWTQVDTHNCCPCGWKKKCAWQLTLFQLRWQKAFIPNKIQHSTSPMTYLESCMHHFFNLCVSRDVVFPLF